MNLANSEIHKLTPVIHNNIFYIANCNINKQFNLLVMADWKPPLMTTLPTPE